MNLSRVYHESIKARVEAQAREVEVDQHTSQQNENHLLRSWLQTDLLSVRPGCGWWQSLYPPRQPEHDRLGDLL